MALKVVSNTMPHADYVLARMNQFQLNSKFCDVCLVAGTDQSQILAHRVILSAASEFYCNMFSADMKESRNFEVILPEVPSIILERIINYIYTGNVNITIHSVVNILKWSHLYMLPSLVRRCEEFMISNINAGTFEVFDDLAETYDLKKLTTEIYRFVDDNFMDLFPLEEFQAISVTKLKKFVARDTLVVRCEENIFEAMEKWLAACWSERQKYFPELLPLLRFPLLDPKYIHERIKPISTSSEVLSIILDAFHWHLAKPDDRSGKFIDRPRNWSTAHTDIVCYESEIYSFYSGWKRVFKLDYSGGIDMYDYVVNGRVFVYRRANKIYAINFADEFPAARFVIDDCSHGAMVMTNANDLYIIGGWSNKKFSKKVSIIDIWTGRKREGVPLRERIPVPVAVYYEDGIYIVGPKNNHKFNMVTKEWHRILSRIISRRFHYCVVHDMYLYIMGGESFTNNSNQVERYNFYDNTWCNMAPLKAQGHILHAGIFNKKIMVIMNCGFRNDRVFVYDDEFDNWMDFPSLPKPNST